MIATSTATPIGTAWIAGTDEGIAALRLGEPDPAWEIDPAAHPEARRQLAQYFARERETFELPLNPGGTPFQRRVWDRLLEIPFGRTTSYGVLADELGSVARAVGSANGANPIWLVVPCHRVLGAKGELTGYAGGLRVKRWLLDFEAAQKSLF